MQQAAPNVQPDVSQCGLHHVCGASVLTAAAAVPVRLSCPHAAHSIYKPFSEECCAQRMGRCCCKAAEELLCTKQSPSSRACDEDSRTKMDTRVQAVKNARTTLLTYED